MERIDSDDHLRRIHNQGSGFIYNDFGGPNLSNANREFNMLHRAGCRECNPRRDHSAMTVRTTGQKLFFKSYREAVFWLLEHRPSNYSKCARCDPR